MGADAYSDYPEEARALPRIGDAFQVDYERVLALHPDLVLVWDTGTPEPVIEKLRSLGLRVERIATARLEDIAEAIRRIGVLAGTEAQAEEAAVHFTAQIAELRRKHAQDAPVSVFFQISVAPLFYHQRRASHQRHPGGVRRAQHIRGPEAAGTACECRSGTRAQSRGHHCRQ